MVQKTAVIKNQMGLCIKPAGAFSNIALSYPCNVYLKVREYEVNAKSLLGILSAQVKEGEEVNIVCDGAEEQECLDAIITAVENGFGL